MGIAAEHARALGRLRAVVSGWSLRQGADAFIASL
jgi:hypothetical protein